MVAETARTTVVICHDLSSMERFDRIYVLDRGRLVDSGAHEALLDRCAEYADLYDAWKVRAGRLETMEDTDDACESHRLAC